MTDEYTPTTLEVRRRYAAGTEAAWVLFPKRDRAEFDRWLAAKIRQAKAEALREAADGLDGMPHVWLRSRADRIAAGDQG